MAASREAASPLLPAAAQQHVDALVQGGPAGLVREESQEVGAEGWHLGPRVASALWGQEAWVMWPASPERA